MVAGAKNSRDAEAAWAWPNTLTHVVSAWADTKRAKRSLGSHTASLLPFKSLLRLKGRQPRFLFLVEIESVRLRRMYRMMFWPSLENMTNQLTLWL